MFIDQKDNRRNYSFHHMIQISILGSSLPFKLKHSIPQNTE